MVTYTKHDQPNRAVRTLTALSCVLLAMLGSTAQARASLGLTVGATVSVPPGLYAGCGGGHLDPCSAPAFDQLLSTGLQTPISPASTAQKVYLKEGELPATPPASWVAYVRAGGRLLVSYKPQVTFSAGEDAMFRRSLDGMVAALGTTTWKLTLWQEANRFFTAAAYKAYVGHYAPIVRAVSPAIQIVYDPAYCSNRYRCGETGAVADYPGNRYTDGVYADFYGTDYEAGVRLDGLEALADRHRPDAIPFGVAEWGATPNGPWDGNVAAWNTYVTYLIRVFQTRMSRGLPCGWVIYYGGQGGKPNQAGNEIATPFDPRIPAFQRLVQTLGPRMARVGP